MPTPVTLMHTADRPAPCSLDAEGVGAPPLKNRPQSSCVAWILYQYLERRLGSC